MNLHAIVGPIINMVNPSIEVRYYASMPSVLDENTGCQIPKYAPPIHFIAQLQPLSQQDLQHVGSINQQRQTKALYLNGTAKGIDRPELRGGDLFEFNGKRWLLTQQIEDWNQAGWCKVLLTEQQDSVETSPEGYQDGSENIIG